MNRLRYLDGLRGIAAIAVAIFSHFMFFTQPFRPEARSAGAPFYEILGPLYNYSWFAVDVFFVISGMVFAHVYGGRLPSAAVFALRRFARLYPLHLLTLVATAILAGLFAALYGRTPFGEDESAWLFLLNVLFIQYGVVNEVYSFNTPAWSLSVEAVMYALFFLSVRSRRPVMWAWAWCAVGAAVLLSEVGWHHWPLLNDSITRGLVGFFGGVLI
jgi:peptidoglycan/LPS O-acetylase OafA/YrhL